MGGSRKVKKPRPAARRGHPGRHLPDEQRPARRAKVGPERINPALHGLVRPLSGLRNDPENARLHPERNLQALAASLTRFGQQKPVVALIDGTVIAGNGLLSAAKAAGWRKLAVVLLDTDDRTEARAYALADNRTAELSKWDPLKLTASLVQVPDLGVLGWDADELRALTADVPEPGDGEGGGRGDTSHSISLTAEQHEVVMRAVEKLRGEVRAATTGEPEMSDGRCLELVCAEYLS